LHELGRFTGTSFAAPFVTAAAALLVSRANRRAMPAPPQMVGRVLRESARPFPGATIPGGMGRGVLDAAAALRLLDRELDWQANPEHEGEPLEVTHRGGAP